MNGNNKKAEQLLRAQGIEEYVFNSIEVDTEIRDSQLDGEVSPQHTFIEGSATFDLTLYESGSTPDHYLFQGIMTMDGYHETFRAADRVDDIIGITWNTNHWSLGNTTEVKSPFMYKFGEGDRWHDVSVDGYDPNKSGVTGAVDIIGGDTPPSGKRGEVYEDEVSFALEGYVQALDDHKPPLFFEYFHNRSYPYKGSIENITVGVSENGLGVSIDFTSGASTAWDDNGYTEFED